MGYYKLTSLSLALYRRLLAFYPDEFRRQYGPLMIATFAEMHEPPDASGSLFTLFSLWAKIIKDLLISVPSEHLSAYRKKRMSWKTWTIWVLISVLGWVAGSILGYPFDNSPVLAPLGGAVVAVLHTLLLQSTLAPPGWWRHALPLSVSGWLLTVLLLALYPWEQLNQPQAESALLLTLFGGLLFAGLLQMLAFRSLLRRPFLWAFTPLIALFVGMAAGLTFNSAAIDPVLSLIQDPPLALTSLIKNGEQVSGSGIWAWFQSLRPIQLWTVVHLLTAVVTAALYGAITGTIFVRLSKSDATGNQRLA